MFAIGTPNELADWRDCFDLVLSVGDLCFGLAVGEREWSEGGVEECSAQSRNGMTRANGQTEAPRDCALCQP